MTLTVTGLSNSDSEQKVNYVTLVDSPSSGEVPVSALALHGPSRARVNSSVAFSATVGAGDNVSYTWDFGDDTTATGPAVSHSYSAGGSYTVTLTASNSQGSEQVTGEIVVKHALLLPTLKHE